MIQVRIQLPGQWYQLRSRFESQLLGFHKRRLQSKCGSSCNHSRCIQLMRSIQQLRLDHSYQLQLLLLMESVDHTRWFDQQERRSIPVQWCQQS